MQSIRAEASYSTPPGSTRRIRRRTLPIIGTLLWLVASTGAIGVVSAAGPVVIAAAPTAPGNVTATPISTSSIRLDWIDSSGETSYNFFRWNGSAWVHIGTGAQNSTSINSTGLAPATTYYHHVCAVNAAGQTCGTYATATTLP